MDNFLIIRILFAYIFRFAADTSLNLFKKLSTARSLGFTGATHVDDFFYIFRLV